jgi:amidase
VVERLERRGGIVIAKSNTPEFGAGGSTFNEVFGRTRNSWNTALTPGGSTGGGAAALAAGCALHPQSHVQCASTKNAHEHTGEAEAFRPSPRSGSTTHTCSPW